MKKVDMSLFFLSVAFSSILDVVKILPRYSQKQLKNKINATKNPV